MTKDVISGACARLLHLSDSGGAIFSARPTGTSKTVRVVASSKSMPFAPSVGESIAVWGKFVSDRKYGLQLCAESVVRSIPTGKGIVSLLSKHPDFAWFSPLLAKRLWTKLGDRLYDALSKPDIRALAYSANISSAHATTLANCWRQYKLEFDICAFLETYELPRELTSSIRKFWGKHFREALTNNPYILVPLSTWSKVDSSCAGKTGIPYNEADRLIAACTSSTDDFVGHKYSVGVPVEELAKRVALKLGNKELAKRALKLAQESGHLHLIRLGSLEVLQTKGFYYLTSALTKRISAFGNVAANLTERINDEEKQKLIQKRIIFLDVTGRDIFRYFFKYFKNSQHIFPSISMGHQVFTQRKEFKLISEVGNLDDVSEWASQYYLIYCADCMDLATTNRVLHRIPEVATVIFIPSSSSSAHTPIGFWSWFLAMPEVCRVSTMGWTASEDYRSCKSEGMSTILPAALRVTSPEAISFRFVLIKGIEGATNAVLQAYRQAAHIIPALIVTETRTACKKLNECLHAEAVELREFEGLPIPTLRLRNGVTATIGDRIVAKHTNHDNKITIGALGIIADICYSTNGGPIAQNPANSIAADVMLDTVGLVRLTFADCKLFDLGYAVPIELDRFSAFEHRIVYVESSDSFRLNNLYPLIARTGNSMCFLGEQEHLEALRTLTQKIYEQ